MVRLSFTLSNYIKKRCIGKGFGRLKVWAFGSANYHVIMYGAGLVASLICISYSLLSRIMGCEGLGRYKREGHLCGSVGVRGKTYDVSLVSEGHGGGALA